MDRRKRTFVVVAVAVFTAALASFAVYRAIAAIPVREVEVAHNYVVVASKPLEMGTVLTKDDLKVVAWPSASQVPGSFVKPEVVFNRGLVAPMAQNEPITEAKLAPVGAGGGLPPSIPPGMRAISVKVNEVIGVAGFTVPGTRVDVVVTVRQKDDSMSRVVVSNVQVLTAGTRYDQEQARDGKPIPSTVVTLLVTPPDAERIALASSEGSITLALRNPLDQNPTATIGVRTASLMGRPDPAPVPKATKGGHKVMVTPKPAVVAVPPPPYVVEAIRAAKRTEEPVKDSIK